MSPRRFNYFDERWKTEVLECPKCHWLGTFEQGSVEHYVDQMDSTCPKCNVSQSPILAVVLYPTLPELRANMDKPGVREWIERIDRGFDEFEAQKLREPLQLPDIGEGSFELVWDFDDSNRNDPRTLIKHGNVVVFSEPARFEEFRRFGEVCAILKARYGERMKDLVPTLRSEGWLYGNARDAKNFVEWFRLDYFGVGIAKQQQARSETESLVRSLSFLDLANQQMVHEDSQTQLPLNFEAQQPDEKTSNGCATKRPVPGISGARWERTEDGTSLIMEPNAEFDSLPSKQRTEIIGRMLVCMDAPDHMQRVTALRHEFANGLPEKAYRRPDDWPSAFSHFEYGPELPDIDAETFSVTFDYSNDGSRYFVLYDEQVILTGHAEHDVDGWVKDNKLREQFLKITRKLKSHYGGQIVDLIATEKAKTELMDTWGWCLPLDEAQRIVQQPESTV